MDRIRRWLDNTTSQILKALRGLERITELNSDTVVEIFALKVTI